MARSRETILRVLISLTVAFGIFSRALETGKDEYQLLHDRADGIDLADSITVDGHKMLNVVCKTCTPIHAQPPLEN